MYLFSELIALTIKNMLVKGLHGMLGLPPMPVYLLMNQFHKFSFYWNHKTDHIIFFKKEKFFS